MKLHEIQLRFRETEDRNFNDLEIRCIANDDGTWQIATQTGHGYIRMDPKDLDSAVQSLSGVRDFVLGIQRMLEEKTS